MFSFIFYFFLFLAVAYIARRGFLSIQATATARSFPREVSPDILTKLTGKVKNIAEQSGLSLDDRMALKNLFVVHAPTADEGKERLLLVRAPTPLAARQGVRRSLPKEKRKDCWLAYRVSDLLDAAKGVQS